MRWPLVGPVVPPIVAPIFSYPMLLPMTSSTSTAWPLANRAFYYPVRVRETWACSALWWVNGSTASGSVDAGIYDDQGNLLVSAGSKTPTGTLTPQTVAVSPAVVIPAGNVYFALAASSTATTFAGPGGAISMAPTWGIYTQTSAFALPSTATFASTASVTTRMWKFGALKHPR